MYARMFCVPILLRIPSQPFEVLVKYDHDSAIRFVSPQFFCSSFLYCHCLLF